MSYQITTGFITTGSGLTPWIKIEQSMGLVRQAIYFRNEKSHRAAYAVLDRAKAMIARDRDISTFAKRLDKKEFYGKESRRNKRRAA